MIRGFFRAKNPSFSKIRGFLIHGKSTVFIKYEEVSKKKLFPYIFALKSALAVHRINRRILRTLEPRNDVSLAGNEKLYKSLEGARRTVQFSAGKSL